MTLTDRRGGLALIPPAVVLTAGALACACQRPDPPAPPVLSTMPSMLTPSEPKASNTSAQEGFRRMKLGALRISVISDGTAVRDVAELVTKVPKEEVLSLAAQSFRDPKMELSINTFLIDRDGHLVLIDAGAGDLFKPEAGLLSDNLRAAGYEPARIEAVILSHVHADHSGGLIQGGAKVFPNATIYVPAADYDLFLSKKEEEKASEKVKHVFKDAQACLDPYVQTGQAKKYDWNTEIVPGITGTPAAGHTPGHSYLTVESKGEKLVILGDTIHVAEVQFPRPEAAVTLDMDQDAAASQRRRGLESVAASGVWTALQHVSFPGIGHVRRDGNGFVWIPMPYAVSH